MSYCSQKVEIFVSVLFVFGVISKNMIVSSHHGYQIIKKIGISNCIFLYLGKVGNDCVEPPPSGIQ